VRWSRGEGDGKLLTGDMLGATELDAADAGKVVEVLLRVEYDERD
jgi:hypothetical protein